MGRKLHTLCEPNHLEASLVDRQTRIIGIARCDPNASCESCDRPARFLFQYRFTRDGGELILCDQHLQDLLCSDQSIMAMVLDKLHQVLDGAGSPLLLP
jgi:hypothetical protein